MLLNNRMTILLIQLYLLIDQNFLFIYLIYIYPYYIDYNFLLLYDSSLLYLFIKLFIIMSYMIATYSLSLSDAN